MSRYRINMHGCNRVYVSKSAHNPLSVESVWGGSDEGSAFEARGVIAPESKRGHCCVLRSSIESLMGRQSRFSTGEVNQILLYLPNSANKGIVPAASRSNRARVPAQFPCSALIIVASKVGKSVTPMFKPSVPALSAGLPACRVKSNVIAFGIPVAVQESRKLLSG